MAGDRHIYGEINSETDMRKIFTNIRGDIEAPYSRPALTELYKRAGDSITLTHAPSWQEKFGRDAESLREVGKEEFRKTAKQINHRAAQIGTEPDFDDTWGTER